MGGRRNDSNAPIWRRARAGQAKSAAISAQRISDLIGEIYDCVLDPLKWEQTLQSINRELAFINSVLGLVPFRPGGHIVNVNAGIDDDWLALANDDSYRADAVALWGGADRMQAFPLDEPIVHSQAVGSSERRGNRYFQRILEPRGIFDAILVPIAREPSLLGYAAFNRHESRGDIGEFEVSTLRLLAPHFRRGVIVSDLFNMQAIEAATFGATLDAVAFGVVLVDAALGLVHANAAAEAMLIEADQIRLVNGAVTLPTRVATDALLGAVERAALDEVALGQRGIGIPAPRKNGEPGVVHVLSLRHREMRRGLVQRAAAALFVVPGSGRARVPTDAVALLYNLTPAEARVMELIVAGRPKTEISDTLGVAVSTVNSHLLQVFAKTGCKRQAELLKLVAGLSLPG